MQNILDETTMMNILDTCYEKVINGIPGFDGPEELAQKYLSKHESVDEAIDDFVRFQKAKCMTSGFLTGLGGLITLPVAIPANLASILYVQIRMIATIAIMRGYNIHDDEVKTLIYVCLTGHSALDILKQGGIQIGTKMGTALVKKFLEPF